MLNNRTWNRLGIILTILELTSGLLQCSKLNENENCLKKINWDSRQENTLIINYNNSYVTVFNGNILQEV